ncbi:AfsR/SARP family transcriptional regulator [Candidatus Leptofilum sp.]|uniref:AfsR/SARP family transcriptional regulator n=1 Tax=Candidatus Leptofilum sp. TaxID=3241576 RepID=UPI003B597A9C
MATVQTAAEQICRSCLQLQSVAHVHAQAQTDLANQEKALRRELWNLLQRFLVPEEDLLDLDELLAAMNALPATQTNWLHRVKSFFQRKPALPQPIQAPGVAAELAPAAKLLTEQLPMLDVYCLGTFRVYNNDALIAKWPGVKCQSIFKYMIFHRERPAPLEVLMDLFWREDEPEAARRNLYQAIYLLRQALQESAPAFNYVVSADGCYGFNSELNIWLDAEDFERLYENGRRHAREGNIETAVAAYESAAALYNGPFFAEDLYEAWMQPPRERLHRHNLNLLEQLSRHYFNAQQFALSISYARKIVTEDSCHEAAHRLLMTAYAHRGQRHLALRQYHQCAEALQAELDAVPSPETAVLHEKIKKNQLQF